MRSGTNDEGDLAWSRMTSLAREGEWSRTSWIESPAVVRHWAYHDALVNLADHLPDSLTLFLVEFSTTYERAVPSFLLFSISQPSHAKSLRL